MKDTKKRIFGLDLIRFLAVLFVITVHSFIYNNYYTSNMSGLYMFILTLIRNLSFVCVPLFIILTGYLQSDETISKNHYKKIKPIIISYIIISIITILFKYFYLKEHDLINLVLGIVNYKTIDYCWYFEMYIGLFLLLPFFNILYKNIETKKEKQILLITLIVVTSLSETIATLGIENYHLNILPGYWSRFYPVTYYFIGCYIKEYQLHINKYLNLILIATILFFQSILLYYYCYNYNYIERMAMDYNNLFTILIATCIFILLYQKNTSKKIIPKMIKKISIVSFNMYLISYIFDTVYYKEFSNILKGKYQLLKALVIVVPIVFISSFMTSIIIDWITRLIAKISRKRKERKDIKN